MKKKFIYYLLNDNISLSYSDFYQEISSNLRT